MGNLLSSMQHEHLDGPTVEWKNLENEHRQKILEMLINIAIHNANEALSFWIPKYFSNMGVVDTYDAIRDLVKMFVTHYPKNENCIGFSVRPYFQVQFLHTERWYYVTLIHDININM